MQDELRREQRREVAYERLGTRQPKCQHCGESDPVALQGSHPDIACYQCSSRQAGKSDSEAHHLAGRHNSPFTMPLAANGHRVLSDRQRDWPERTLRNPDGSPLLKASATLRGWLDVLWLIVERMVGHIPIFLEDLDERLRQSLGERWWEELGMEGAPL